MPKAAWGKAEWAEDKGEDGFIEAGEAKGGIIREKQGFEGRWKEDDQQVLVEVDGPWGRISKQDEVVVEQRERFLEKGTGSASQETRIRGND